MSRWNLAWLLGTLGVALVGLSVLQSAPSIEPARQRKHENLRLLVDVLEEVQHKYVKELDQDKMRELVENMINGGLERLDPHSGYINPKEFKHFQTQSRGKFGGVGIRIGLHPKSGALLVDSPMVGTPAYEAGVLAGDIIVKIDGKTTENVGLKEAVDLIQGEPGSKVTLTVVHAGQKKLVDLAMTRAEIVVHSVLGDQRKAGNLKEWDFMLDKENKLAYVRLQSFAETTAAELADVVQDLQRQGMKGLVLDLRTNPGGLLKAAVEISNMFLPEGKRIVSTKGRNHRDEIYDALRRGSVLPNAAQLPLVILINRYSASASEIVAAALQDHFRAVVVGERSYGKGSVQNVILMENSTSALKLTTASYWRPNGKNIHRFPDSKEKDEWGVSPNKGYEVKLTDEERLRYFEWRRERDVVRKPGQPAPPPSTEPEAGKERDAEPFHDRALEKGLEYLREQLRLQTRQGARLLLPAARPQGVWMGHPALATTRWTFGEEADTASWCDRSRWYFA
jgi:carboxyl-terminal processing protease